MQTILHIGQPKTGTTALQTTLHANQESLARIGAFYPRLPYSSSNHQALGPAVFRREHVAPYTLERMDFDPAVARRMSEEQWDVVEAEIGRRRPDRLLLSSEAFFRPLFDDEAARLTERLARLARAGGGDDGTRILAYIRSPASLFLTMFQQQLRNRRHLRPITGRHVLPQVRAYEKAFGKDRVIVRPFDRATLVDGDIVSDFFDATGLGQRPPGFREAGEANVSISAEAMAALQRQSPDERGKTAAAVHEQRRLRHRILRADRLVPGHRRPSLRPEIRDVILAGADEYLVLRDSYGISFSDLDYSAIGRPIDPALRELWRVEDICPVDPDRLARVIDQARPSLAQRLRHRLRAALGTAQAATRADSPDRPAATPHRQGDGTT